MTDQYENFLAHYGILRRSGRYPWGSGGTEVSRSRGFLTEVARLRAAPNNLSDTEIARGFGMTTTELRAANSMAKNIKKSADITMAQRLKERGWSNIKIGERMGINESSVRSLLAPGAKDKTDVLQSVSSMLKDQVDSKKFIDVGTGVEAHLAISPERLSTAIAMLKEQGYVVHNVQVDQLGTGNKTTVKVLAPAGTQYKDIAANKHLIQQITEYSDDGGRNWSRILPPLSIDKKRVDVVYGDEGGAKADGVIYVRPGVKDVSLGGASYAQVRIAVNGTHYLKGMAVYKDDLPDGVDLQFNTNKSRTANKLDAMKEMKDDIEDPFGSMLSRQIGEKNSAGRLVKVTSVMNLVNEEGDWDRWSRSLPSQFLSKQSPKMAQKQLDLKLKQKQEELDEIMALTNPAVRKRLLESYADDADSSAVHLKAAQIKRQATQVILPINSLKDTEVYAPNFRDGEDVVLVRFPHGGTFEIPQLKVNNRNPEGRKIIGAMAPDAIGINSNVARRLSGADFDGDSVLVLPNKGGNIKSTPALEGLKNFDPQSAYPAYEGMKPMSSRTKGIEMGKVSNLITDMTIKGASTTELAAAVRHSMVVIDAEKHKLNWKQSEIDNGIRNLNEKYQQGRDGGASTLISRAKSRLEVRDRKERGVDPKTGEKIFVETGKSWQTAKGTTKFKTITTTKLAEAKDAHTLSSGTKIEAIYAVHSNRLKALANAARKEAVTTKPLPWSDSAKKIYAPEIQSLNAKLNLAIRNRPLERQAQILAGSTVSMKRASNPDMDDAELKKLKSKALTEARFRTGAESNLITFTPREWEAIQAGALSSNKLGQILDKADLDHVKKLATPKATVLLTPTKTRRAQSLLDSGLTQAEVADILGVSVSTLKNTLKEG